MEKFLINFTPTGMMPGKDKTPALPVSPEEIIREVGEARKYGISIVHLHARDENGNPTWKSEVYRQIIEGIRQQDKSGNDALILCVSTSGRNWADFERRTECLDLDGNAKPDMASLTLGSLNFHQTASTNSPDMIQDLARKMKKKGIKPELEVFDLGMINYSKYLVSKKLIEPPFYFNLIFGNIATAQAGLLEPGIMVSQLPKPSIWSAGGIGSDQLKMNLTGMLHGGGIRIGLEDNIWFDRNRTQPATNLELLKRIKEIAVHLEMEPYSPLEVRNMLSLHR